MQVFRGNGFRCTDSHKLPLFITEELRIQQTAPKTKKPSPCLPCANPISLYMPYHSFSFSFSFSFANTNLKNSFMDSTAFSKSPCFWEEDQGLAFLADVEAGYSGQNLPHYQFHRGFVSRCMGYATSNGASFRIRGLSVSSQRSGRFYDARYEDRPPYFLEACYLCKKLLGDNRDIFMYRGDTPFCSEECRQEQIDMDEAKEKNRNLSSSMKAMRNKEQTESTSPSKTQDYSCVRGTVAAA